MAKKIYVVGNIGRDWWSGDGVTAQDFAREFDAALASGEDIEVEINSPGGSVFDGIAIYNKIAANADKVTTIVTGIAYSMGAIIAMAAKSRKAYKNATIMIHNVSGGAYGNAKSLRSALEMMDALDNSLIESVAQFTGLTSDDVKAKWFDYNDHTMSAQAALDAGLLTEVIDLSAENVPSNLGAMSQKDLFAYFAKLNATQERDLFARFTNYVKDKLIPKDGKSSITPTSEDTNSTEMKVIINKSSAALVASLGLSFSADQTEMEVDITAEHMATLNAKLTEHESNITTLTNEKNALQEKVNKLPGAGETNTPNNAGGEGAGAVKESLSIKAPEVHAEYKTDY